MTVFFRSSVKNWVQHRRGSRQTESFLLPGENILIFFSNWYQVNIFFLQFITRWKYCDIFSNWYQVNIFFQITTRWKYFSISFKIDTRWICFLQIITKWKYFYIFWNWKLIDWKQKLSNVQRIRCLKKKNEKDILGLLSFQNMSTRKGEREILNIKYY